MTDRGITTYARLKYCLVLCSILLPVNMYSSDQISDCSVDSTHLTDNSNSLETTYIPLVTSNAFMFGAGSANLYDTYLSPLEYKGYSLQLYNERMRRTTWFDHRFYKQQIIGAEFSKTDNPAKNASEYRFFAHYRLGGHYQLFKTERLRLGVGGLWSVNGGVLYNERNGNNPASGQIFTNLELSVTASYKFDKFAVRWQMDSPVIGMLFSPQYGQSYYEISLGNSVGIINFASLHNQRALRNYLTVDVPLNKYIIRVGYLGSYYQTKVHSLQAHTYTHSFVIGMPLEGVKTPKKKVNNIYWD